MEARLVVVWVALLPENGSETLGEVSIPHLELRVRLLELRLRRERDRLEIGALPLLLRLRLATAPARLLLEG